MIRQRSAVSARRALSAVAVATVFAAVGVAASCVTSPETGRRQLIAPSESYMNSMGAQAYADMLKEEKVSNNGAQTSAMVDIGKRIAKASGKGYDWQFTLFESKDVQRVLFPAARSVSTRASCRSRRPTPASRRSWGTK